MGSLTSRQNAGVEEVDIVSNHAYKYPPRSGTETQFSFIVYYFFNNIITELTNFVPK